MRYFEGFIELLSDLWLLAIDFIHKTTRLVRKVQVLSLLAAIASAFAAWNAFRAAEVANDLSSQVANDKTHFERPQIIFLGGTVKPVFSEEVDYSGKPQAKIVLDLVFKNVGTRSANDFRLALMLPETPFRSEKIELPERGTIYPNSEYMIPLEFNPSSISKLSFSNNSGQIAWMYSDDKPIYSPRANFFWSSEGKSLPVKVCAGSVYKTIKLIPEASATYKINVGQSLTIPTNVEKPVFNAFGPLTSFFFSDPDHVCSAFKSKDIEQTIQK
jgi:hypothetical protein